MTVAVAVSPTPGASLFIASVDSLFVDCNYGACALVLVGASVTSTTSDCRTTDLAAVGGIAIVVPVIGSAGDGCTRVLVGARVASTTSYRRTTKLAAVVKIIIIVKLVGDAGDRRARVLVRAHIASTTSNCWTINGDHSKCLPIFWTRNGAGRVISCR